MPQQLGEGISLGLELGRRHDLRTVWVNHSDLAYNRLVAKAFGGWLDGAVGVSDELGTGLHTLTTKGVGENWPLVRTIVNGVPVSACSPVKPKGDGPLRLIAVGRMDHEQKRVLALVHMSLALDSRGVPHELTMVGDGPAMNDVRTLMDACNARNIRLAGGVEPEVVGELLIKSDLFVQASRYEGLSLSMLEAMAAGVPPVVSWVRSGVQGVIIDGKNGIVAEARPEDSPQHAGHAMADGVQRAVEAGRAALGDAAWQTVHERFNVRTQAAQYAELFDQLAVRPRSKKWPPAAFGSAEFGTVPAQAAEMARAVLCRLAGKSVALHGSGAHTRVLATELDLRSLGVLCLLDDDPSLWSAERHGVPVESPLRAHELGISDVVISSWLHQEAIWSRRDQYESQGVRVHRLYEQGTCVLSDEPGLPPPPSAHCATTIASA
jgi:hypothetical protein